VPAVRTGCVVNARLGDLQTIVENGMCCGCGLCASIAGADQVEMTLSPIGQIRPRQTRPLESATLQSILRVCPGVSVTGPSPQRDVTTHPVWGPIASLDRGWARDETIRQHAAAGGALTALALFLLESHRVDAVVHVRASTSEPTRTRAQVSRRREHLLAGAQSRYGPAAPLVHVHELLAADTRIVIIAKPCDVSAIRALQRVDERARRLIPYLLTMFCGGVPSDGMAQQIVASHGVDRDEVTLFRFRGDGWPGPLRTQTRDGRVFDINYDSAWYDPTVPWRYDMQFRCKVCPDAIGEVADVSCPDGWLLEDGRPVHREAPGVNFVIARTGTGRDLVEAARDAGYLATAPLSAEELDATHRDHYPRRLSAQSRLVGIRLAGAPTLRVRGYRGLTVSRVAGLRRSLSACYGAFRRARRGAHHEPPP
jgi:coenzyme F420 hydrogenase subunit beta